MLCESQDRGYPCGYFDGRWCQSPDTKRVELLCDHIEGFRKGLSNVLSSMDYSWTELYGESGPSSYPRNQWAAHAPTLGVTQPTIARSGELPTGAQRGADRRCQAPDPTGLPAQDGFVLRTQAEVIFGRTNQSLGARALAHT